MILEVHPRYGYKSSLVLEPKMMVGRNCYSKAVTISTYLRPRIKANISKALKKKEKNG